MREEVRSLAAWAAVFFAVELPAHFRLGRLPTSAILLAAVAAVIWLWPIFTLSGTGWDGEAWWWPVSIFVAVFVLTLLGHLELHWSARYLIAVGIGATLVIVSHIIETGRHR